MNARINDDFFTKIKRAGFSLTLEGSDNFRVTPRNKLTAVQIEFLRAHKNQIIAALQKQKSINDETVPSIKETEPRCGQFAPIDEPQGETVQCFTPNGAAIAIRAKDEAHSKYLRRMNPRREASSGLKPVKEFLGSAVDKIETMYEENSETPSNTQPTELKPDSEAATRQEPLEGEVMSREEFEKSDMFSLLRVLSGTATEQEADDVLTRIMARTENRADKEDQSRGTPHD